jgi:hypothetical protein
MGEEVSEPGFTDASSSQEAYAIFGSTDMLAALVLMSEISSEARKVGLANIAAPLRMMLQQLESDLSALAARTAQTADAAIVTRLRETQVRPETTRSLHLQDVIVSVPFPRGSVKIGLIEELNKATNPDGYGPYWRAVELGSVAVGNIMTGRILFGHFAGAGVDEAPRAEYRGMRGAPGSEFYFGMDGEESGLGTISNEDPPRYFLRDGTAIAATDYGHAIKSLSRSFADRILALSPGAALP